MIKINSYTKKKNGNGNNGGGSGSTGGITPTVIQTKANKVRIWGQWHDHTGDVDGDITVNGKATISDSVNVPNVITDNVETKHIKSDTAEIEYIQSNTIEADAAIINSIAAQTINASTITGENIYAGLVSTSNLEAEDAIVKNLTVTGKAHFFELVIDKINAAGGAVIYAPANGFKTDYVQWHIDSDSNYNNLPSSFYLPINFKLKDWNNINYSRCVVEVKDNITNKVVETEYGLVVLPMSKDTDEEYVFLYETNELAPKSKYLGALHPELYEQFTQFDVLKEGYEIKDDGTTYVADYGVYTEETDNYVYNINLDSKLAAIDYRINNIYLQTTDIYGKPQRVGKVYSAIKVYNKNVTTEDWYWYILDTGNLLKETALGSLYGNKTNYYNVYTFKYSATINEYGWGKSWFTLTPTLWWRAEDNGKAIRNEWQVGDQAICRNFNEAQVGTNNSVQNKYYWGLVNLIVGPSEISQPEIIYKGDDGNLYEVVHGEQIRHSCHGIVLDCDDFDGVMDCEADDVIAMLGNRYNTERQNAIYISCYASLDPSMKAPLIAQYERINSYSLKNKSTTYFSAGKNYIKGDLVMESGKSVLDAIADNEDDLKKKYEELVDKINNAKDEAIEAGSANAKRTKVLYPVNNIAKKYSDWEKLCVNKSSVTFSSNVAGDFDYKGGDYVLVEQTLADQPDVMDSMNAVKILLYGEIQWVLKAANSNEYRTTVTLYRVINGNLFDLYNGFAELKVTDEQIQSTVTQLDKGLSQITQTADNIKSEVDNLKGDVSKIDQKADSINLEVNDLKLRLDGEKNKIVLDGDTEVNGAVQINKDGVGFTLVGSNGERFDILSKSIGSFDAFAAQTENWWLGTTNQMSFSATASMNMSQYPSTGQQTSWTNTAEVTKSVIIDLGQCKKGQQLKIDNAVINSRPTISYQPNSEACSGSARFVRTNVDVLNYNSDATLANGQSRTLTSSPDKTYIILDYTFPETTKYRLRVNVTFSVTATLKMLEQTGGISSPMKPQPASCTVTASVYNPFIFRYHLSNDAYGQIAYDGIGINFGGGKVLYMGNESCIIKYGENHGFKITDTGIFKMIPARSTLLSVYPDGRDVGAGYLRAGQWQRLNSSNVRKVTAESGVEGVMKDTTNKHTRVYCFEDDDVVLVDTANWTYPNFLFVVPNPTKVDIGRKIYLKTVRSESIQLVSHDYRPSDNIGSSNTILYCYNHINDLCSRCDLMTSKDKSTSIMLLNTGNYWVIYNGGAVWNDDSHQVGSGNYKAS